MINFILKHNKLQHILSRFSFGFLKRSSNSKNVITSHVQQDLNNQILKSGMLHDQLRSSSTISEYYTLVVKNWQPAYQQSIRTIVETIKDSMMEVNDDTKQAQLLVNFLQAKCTDPYDMCVLALIAARIRKRIVDSKKIATNKEILSNLNYSISMIVKNLARMELSFKAICEYVFLVYVIKRDSEDCLQKAERFLRKNQIKMQQLYSRDIAMFLKGFHRYPLKIRQKYPSIIAFVMRIRDLDIKAFLCSQFFNIVCKLELHLEAPEYKLPFELKQVTAKLTQLELRSRDYAFIIEAYQYLPLSYDNTLLYKCIKDYGGDQNMNAQFDARILQEFPYKRVSRATSVGFLNKMYGKRINEIHNIKILNWICRAKILEFADINFLSTISKNTLQSLLYTIDYDIYDFLPVILRTLTRASLPVNQHLRKITENVQTVKHIWVPNQLILLRIIQISKEKFDYKSDSKYENALIESILNRISGLDSQEILEMGKSLGKGTEKALNPIKMELIREMKKRQQPVMILVFHDLRLPDTPYQAQPAILAVKQLVDKLSPETFNELVEEYIHSESNDYIQKHYTLTDLILENMLKRPNMSQFIRFMSCMPMVTMLTTKGTCNDKIRVFLQQVRVKERQNINMVALFKFVKEFQSFKLNWKPIFTHLVQLDFSKMEDSHFLLFCETFMLVEWQDKTMTLAQKIDICERMVYHARKIRHDTIYVAMKKLELEFKVKDLLNEKDDELVNELVTFILKEFQMERFQAEAAWLLIELHRVSFIALSDLVYKQLILTLSDQTINLNWLAQYIKNWNLLGRGSQKIDYNILSLASSLYLTSKQAKPFSVITTFFQMSLKMNEPLLKNEHLTLQTHIFGQLSQLQLRPLEVHTLCGLLARNRNVNDTFMQTLSWKISSNLQFYDQLEIQIIFFYVKSYYYLPLKFIPMIDSLIRSLDTRLYQKRYDLDKQQSMQFYAGRYLNALWSLLLLNKIESKSFLICLEIYFQQIKNLLEVSHSQYILGLMNDIYLLLRLRNIKIDQQVLDILNLQRAVLIRKNPIIIDDFFEKQLLNAGFQKFYLIDTFRLDFYNPKTNTAVLFLHSYLLTSNSQESAYSRIRDEVAKFLIPDINIIKFNLKNQPRKFDDIRNFIKSLQKKIIKK